MIQRKYSPPARRWRMLANKKIAETILNVSSPIVERLPTGVRREALTKILMKRNFLGR